MFGEILKGAGIVLGTMYAYGLVLVLVYGAFGWLTGKPFPDPWWWYFTGFPLLIGALAVSLEATAEFIGNGFTLRQNASPIRKSLGKAAIVLLLAAVLIGGPLYHISHL